MYLRWIYEQVHVEWCTERRLNDLREAENRLSDQNTKAKKVWEKFVAESTSWQEVPDASYMAFRWWQRFIHPKTRRTHQMVDGIPITGPASLSKTKRCLKDKAVGQWKRTGEYQHMMGSSLLADRFAAGYGSTIKYIQIINTQKQVLPNWEDCFSQIC
jgi:hypothetical protein